MNCNYIKAGNIRIWSYKSCISHATFVSNPILHCFVIENHFRLAPKRGKKSLPDLITTTTSEERDAKERASWNGILHNSQRRGNFDGWAIKPMSYDDCYYFSSVTSTWYYNYYNNHTRMTKMVLWLSALCELRIFVVVRQEGFARMFSLKWVRKLYRFKWAKSKIG